jgi:hypothetical protein
MPWTADEESDPAGHLDHRTWTCGMRAHRPRISTARGPARWPSEEAIAVCTASTVSVAARSSRSVAAGAWKGSLVVGHDHGRAVGARLSHFYVDDPEAGRIAHFAGSASARIVDLGIL